MEGSRAIVVDGDPLIRKLLSDLLATMGYDATTRASGPSALAEIYGTRVELLVADVGMSALNLVRELRGKRILLPILLMGDDDHPDLPAALSHSGVSFLPKPFRIAECRKSIARAVGLRR